MGRKPNAPLRVAVLAGGDSAERAVSLASGAGVVRALQQAGHAPEVIDPAGRDLDSVEWERFDGCFLALHGGAGEDGRVQNHLTRCGVAYTGSGPRASRLAMSKSAAKAVFRTAGVPTPDYVLLEPKKGPGLICAKHPPGRSGKLNLVPFSARLVARLGFPLVVKPDGQGSSLGVGIARSAAEFPDRVAQSGRVGSMVLAERLIEGREFTVALFQGSPLPLLEIVGREELFDYRSKYSSTLIEYHFQTGLPPILIEQLRETAARAASALGARGLVRVDLLLDTDNRPWVLELNTLPGMTDHSLAPKAARRAGIDMPRLCDQILRDGLNRRG